VEQERKTMILDYEKAKCPRCGTPMEGMVLTVDPPIHLAKCPECGFEKRVEPYKNKPPTECSPYYVNISARIRELCEAIKRHAAENGKHNQIKLWATEILCLNEMDRTLQRVAKEKTWVVQKDGTLKEDE
jgi:Zn ribbon nucleic-acid-binding protein